MATETIKLNFGIDNVDTLEKAEKKLKEIQDTIAQTSDRAEFDRLSAQARTLGGNIENLNQKFEKMSAEKLTNEFAGMAGAATDAITGIALLAGSSEEDMAKLGQTISQVMGVSIAFKGAIELATKRQLIMATVTDTLTAAQKALSAAMKANPIGIITVALIAAGTALLAYLNTTKELNEEQLKLNQEQKDYYEIQTKTIENASKEIANITTILTKIDNENTSRKDRNNLIKDLEKLYPGYLDNMDKEQLAAGNTAKAYEKLKEAILNKARANAIQDKLTAAVTEQLKAEEGLAAFDKMRLASIEIMKSKGLSTVVEEIKYQEDRKKVLDAVAVSQEKVNSLLELATTIPSTPETKPTADKWVPPLPEIINKMEAIKVTRVENEETTSEEIMQTRDEETKNLFATYEEIANYENKLHDDKIKNQMEYFSLASNVANSIGNLTQAIMDQELAGAEGNEQKQEAIRKKYAGIRKASMIAQTVATSAQGVAGLWGQAFLSEPPPMALATATILTPILLATMAAQIALIAKQKFAMGGTVFGAGVGDTVPAMLTPGEFVLRKDVANSIGHDNLNKVNSGNVSFDGAIMESFMNRITAIPVVVSEKDITKTQRRVNVIEKRTSF